MKLFTLIALIALCVSTAFAQGEALPLPFVYTPVDILTNQTIGSSAYVTSTAVPDPSEFVSMDYVTPTVGASSLSVTVLYSDKEAGPFVAGVDGATIHATNTISWNTTPSSGCDVHFYPSKWAKFRFNSGGIAISLTRLTALRKKIGVAYRPQILATRTVDIGLANTTVSGTTTSDYTSTVPFVSPFEFVGFFLDTDGSVGTRNLRAYYSNSEDGPWNAWVDQGFESVAYQNTITTTAKQAYISAKPFPAAYVKFKLQNASGYDFDVTTLSGTRKEQVKR